MPNKFFRSSVDKDDLSRVDSYEATIRAIRRLIFKDLSKEQKKRLFDKDENEIGTRDLVALYVHQYMRLKYPERDPDIIENTTTQIRNRQGLSEGDADHEISILQAHIDDLKQQYETALQRKNHDIRQWESSSKALQVSHDRECEKLQSDISKWIRSHRALESDKKAIEQTLGEKSTKLASIEDKWQRHCNTLTHKHTQNLSEWASHAEELKREHQMALQSQNAKHQSAIERAQASVKKEWQEYVDAIKVELGQKLAAKDDEYDTLLGEKQSIESTQERTLQIKEEEFQDEIKRLNNIHEEELLALSSDHQDEQRRLKTNHSSRVSELTAGHQQAYEQLENDKERQQQIYEADIKLLKSEHEHALQELKTGLLIQINNLIGDIKRQKEDYEAQILNLQNDHAREVADMESQHKKLLTAAVKGYQNDIASLNAILFARERFTAVPDRQLKEKFLGLRHDVSNLARQTWKDSHPIWTSSVVRSITSNPDELRQQLLRDTIWWILHDRVFCSPWRMFGDKGLSLEQQWNAAYGKDAEFRTGEYIWPKPDFNGEKMRYDAIKECQTALREAAADISPRAKIKKGFKESREGLLKALKTAVNDVAIVDQTVFADVEKLVKKSIAVWIEFQLQRCRLMVSMPIAKVGSEQEKVSLAKERTLELTSLPGLLRYGDDGGQDLHIKQTVSGCAEEPIRVS